MPATAYDTENFFRGLVDAKLIIPVGVPGIFGRGAVFEEVLGRFNDLVSRIAVDDAAECRAFPPVIARKVIERNNYLESFPHLCGSVFSFNGKEISAREMAERAARGEPWHSYLEMTDVCLAPAICYPLYPTLAGRLPPGGRLFSMLGWAFRHEPSPEPTRMQSFRMREFIRAGQADEVLAWRNMWHQRGIKLLGSLGLPVHSDLASDPFFGKGGRMLAANQRQQQLKFELLVPVISQEHPTAVCSFNFHQEHFGETFDIRTADDEVASTACLGFGLERVTMALFQAHGFDPRQWPSEVRAQLWP